MKVITANRLNRFWKKGILPIKEGKLDKGNVLNALTATEEGYALDARQGKLLDEKISYLSSNSDGVIGSIIAYMGKNAPNNYLPCNGGIYNISEYPILALHFEDEFGKSNYFGGNGSETFAVPDLRGEFLRGTGVSKYNKGSGATVGTHQDPTGHPFVASGSSGIFLQTNTQATNPDTTITGSNSKVGASSSIDTSITGRYYTARPTNTAVLYCIRCS